MPGLRFSVSLPVLPGGRSLISLDNQDGVVYEKNLGSGTDAAVRAISAYNPDASWSKVAPTK